MIIVRPSHFRHGAALHTIIADIPHIAAGLSQIWDGLRLLGNPAPAAKMLRGVLAIPIQVTPSGT